MTDQDKSDLLEWLNDSCNAFESVDVAIRIACIAFVRPELIKAEWELYQLWQKASTDLMREWVVDQWCQLGNPATEIEIMQTIRDEFESRFGVVVN